MTKGAIHGLALCAGVGGLELGLQLAMPKRYSCVGYVEREAYAAVVLMARMEDEALDRAPIWDDLATFDGKPYRGRVDLVTSGLPCQPYSVAGKGKGHDDERALWPHFVRIVGECEPALVFLENVPAFRKHFEPVWRELQRLGFEWAPPLLQTASEYGAPHIRERFYALAAHPERIELRDEQGGSGGEGWPGQAGPVSACNQAPDPDRGRRESEWCGWVFDSERETLRHDANRCGDGCRICGTFWDSESPPIRVATSAPDRVDRLRAIGNVGAPPLAYAAAFSTLVKQLGIEIAE